MEMLKKQDVALVAGFAFTQELAQRCSLESCSLILVIPTSCHSVTARLAMFGSLDFISSVKNQMSYSVHFEE